MRYYVFAGSHYYPSGGMYDHYASCESFEEAQRTVSNIDTRNTDWYQIFDMDERKIVERGSI